MCLVLTDAEIVQRYKNAEKKEQQIRIMADLNDCSVQEIKDTLKRNGIRMAEIKKKTNSTKESISENLIKSMDLDLQSGSDVSKNGTSKELSFKLPVYVMAALTDRVDQLKEQEESIQATIEDLEIKLRKVKEAQKEISSFIEDHNP